MIVYTGGTFDLFHSGHVNFLKQCKKIAGKDGKVVVALNTDEFIEEYKKKKPIYDYWEREIILSACEYVDEVVPNTSGADSKPTIMEVNPDCIVIGSDWQKKDYHAQMQFTQEWLDDNNILLFYVPYTEGISSTLVKQRIQDSQVKQESEFELLDIKVEYKKPLFTAIVPAHANEDLTFECIKNLTYQNYLPMAITVYVSDMSIVNLMDRVESIFMLPVYGFTNCENENDWGQSKVAQGIEVAHGKYLGIFNIDDIYDKHYINKMVRKAELEELDLVYCDREEKDGSIVIGEPVLNKGDRGMFIVRTELAQKVGYNHRDYGADGRFLEELVKAGAKHARLPEVLYKHR